jgi:hypothetical protein
MKPHISSIAARMHWPDSPVGPIAISVYAAVRSAGPEPMIYFTASLVACFAACAC